MDEPDHVAVHELRRRQVDRDLLEATMRRSPARSTSNSLRNWPSGESSAVRSVASMLAAEIGANNSRAFLPTTWSREKPQNRS
jgi:hypothetical protein